MIEELSLFRPQTAQVEWDDDETDHVNVILELITRFSSWSFSALKTPSPSNSAQSKVIQVARTLSGQVRKYDGAQVAVHSTKLEKDSGSLTSDT